MSARDLFLTGAKAAGGFWLADRVRPAGIPILCYHGFSRVDEHRFRPALFIRPEEFERRLVWLLRSGYKVIALAEALERLEGGRLGKREVVLTIDDGFHTVGSVGWPLLKKYNLPATLYVTTYYATHPNPIFRLAIQYFFWKTARQRASLGDLCPALTPGDDLQRDRMWQLIRWAETELSEDARWRLAQEVAARLDVDAEELRSSRRLSLLTVPELAELARDGLDLQLHTHRHTLPVDPHDVTREISQNRGVLQGISGDRPLVHFCYPSGEWSTHHWPTLGALGIRSATTCEPGFNTAGTPPLRLYRFLDSEELSQRDFEAELSGFKSVLRAVRGAKAAPMAAAAG